MTFSFCGQLSVFARFCALASCLAFASYASATANGPGPGSPGVASNDDGAWVPVQWREDRDERIAIRPELPVLDLEVPQGYIVRVVLTEASRDDDVTARLVSHGHPIDEDPGVEMRRKPGSREVSFRFRRRTRDGEHIVIVASPPMRKGPRQRIVVRVR